MFTYLYVIYYCQQWSILYVTSLANTAYCLTLQTKFLMQMAGTADTKKLNCAKREHIMNFSGLNVFPLETLDHC